MGSRRCTRCSRSRSRRRLCDCRAIPAQFGAQFLPRKSLTGPPLPLRLQAKTLNANKLARFALEKLAQYKVPVAWQEQVDLFALSVRGRPLVDAEELLPSCFRCQVRRRGPSLSHPSHSSVPSPSHRSSLPPSVLPLPDDQPVAQPERRQVHRVRPPLHPLLRLVRGYAAPPPRHRPATSRRRRPARHRV